MSIREAMLIALFLMLIVFSALVLLSLFLKLQSSFFDYIEKNKTSITETSDNTSNNSIEVSNTTSFKDVGDETVAIILASISYSSNIPLKSLKIKSIKPLN